VKRLIFAGAIVLAAVVSGATIAGAHTSHPVTDFAAALTAKQEVQTPAVVSAATGRARFELSADGTKLHFALSARGLGRITMAHIHLGATGTNGPVVAFLFPEAMDGVNGDGFEVAGTITAADLMGPLAGQTTLANLAQALRSGGAYTNVHTIAHPAGEIRGQIHPAADSDRQTKSVVAAGLEGSHR
jgi:CHRD domain